MMDFGDLIGKPFDPDGYGPDGYSCYGLAVEVYRRYGIDIPRTNISVCACKEASAREIKTHLQKYWRPVEIPTPPTGIVIRSAHPGFANHLGVYIGQDRFIHVTMNRAVVIDRLSAWKSKIIGYFAYVGHSR